MTNELTMTWTLLNPTARFRTFQIHLDSEELLRIIKETLLQIAAKHQVELQIRDQEFVLQNEAGPIAVTTVQPPPDRSCSVFGVAPPPMSRADVLVRRGQVIGSPTVRQVLVELENFFDGVENILSDGEAEFVLRSMPLLELIAPADSPDPVLSQFALIWRDHFLEENIALLRAFERAGIPPSWIYVLSKGDQTAKCDRIAAYFRRRGYHTDLFDSNYPDPIIEQSETQRIRGTLETFVAEARKNGRNIMAIDDGGLLFNCFRDNQRIMDFAVEVTIVGTKRLKRLHP